MQVQVGRQEGKKDGLDRIGGTGENKATDIIGPDTPDSGTWSLLFGETEDIGYEIRMEYDRKRGRKTLRPGECRHLGRPRASRPGSHGHTGG